MKKVIILTIIYFVLGVTSSCFLKYDAFICDIEFTGLNSFGKNNDSPDVFENEIGFEISSIPSSQNCYIPKLNLFNSAYATTKCAEFQNQIITSTYKLRLNRPLILNSDTIYKDTDLLSISEIKNSTKIEIIEECKSVISTIIFNNDLSEQLEFETGIYEVVFECSTNDNRNFTKSREVIFKN